MFFQPVNHLRQIRHSSDALDMLESPPSSAFAASCRSTLRAPTTTSSDSMYHEDMSIYSPDLSDDSSIHSSPSNESISSDNSSRPVSPISIPLPATKFSLGVVRGVNLDQYVDQQSRYVFVSLLGKSIYGCVYKAVDTQTHSYVAIKLSLMDVMRNVYLSQNAKQDYDVLESPLLESQLMKPLSGTNAHPHILQLHNEFFSSDFKVHWMVLEYAPNSDLFEQVSDRKRLSEDEGRIIFAQLVSALKHIHSTGIVHLDMSLENVLLGEQFNVKVCDFGVARPIPSSSKFPSLYIRSKPGYMAPEVLHRQPFDGRKADVFSLGVMLYCMIIGHKPFEFADRAQISYRLISSGRLEEYLTRSSTMVPLSSDVLDLLSRMLCPEEKRITLEEVAAHPFLHGFKL